MGGFFLNQDPQKRIKKNCLRSKPPKAELQSGSGLLRLCVFVEASHKLFALLG